MDSQVPGPNCRHPGCARGGCCFHHVRHPPPRPLPRCRVIQHEPVPGDSIATPSGSKLNPNDRLFSVSRMPCREEIAGTGLPS